MPLPSANLPCRYSTSPPPEDEKYAEIRRDLQPIKSPREVVIEGHQSPLLDLIQIVLLPWRDFAASGRHCDRGRDIRRVRTRGEQLWVGDEMFWGETTKPNYDMIRAKKNARVVLLFSLASRMSLSTVTRLSFMDTYLF